MFQLRITVIHTIGTFSGYLSAPEFAAEEDVRNISDELQESINSIDRLVLTQSDGTEVAFPQKILKESIFIFDVREVE